MYLARWSTLLLAALLSSPALYHGFVAKDLDLTAAMTRFLIAVPVSAIMLALLRTMSKGYKDTSSNHSRRADEQTPERPSDSTPAADPPAPMPTAANEDAAG